MIHKTVESAFAWKSAVIVAALTGLWCVFLWDAFGTDRSFALYMDNEFFIGTILSSMSATLNNGGWPLRMDTILGGVPLYNSTQLSPFYPLYFAFLPIYGSPSSVVHSMHYLTLFHLLILETNMYVFLRVVGASRIASLTGAALVAFSANSFSYASWLTIVAPYSWFPLFLAGIIGLLKCPRSMRYAAMALIGIVLLTLAAPAQPLIHAVLVTTILLCAFSLEKFRIGQARQIGVPLGRVVVVGLLSILLTAPVLLPAALEFKNMIRWVGAFPPVIGNARIPFEAFHYHQLSIADLGGIFYRFQGTAVGHQFAGVVALALAGVAVVSRPHSWRVAALAFLLCYSLISAAGSNLGMAYLNYAVPLLNKIREPTRFLFLFQLAAGTLAGLGVDEFCKAASRNDAGNNPIRHMIALAVVAVGAVISLFAFGDRILSHVPPYLSVAILLALALTTRIVSSRRSRSRSAFIAVLWSGAALTLLAVEVPWIPPPVSNSLYLSKQALALDKAIERIATLDPDREYRVLFDGSIDTQLASMLASYRGVRSFNMYFNPAPLRQFEELYYHGPRPDNYFRILGAKYLVCGSCKEESLKGYKYLENIEGLELYAANDVLPHSFTSNRVDGEFNSLTDFTEKAAGAALAKGLLFVEPGAAVGLGESGNAAGDDCDSHENVRTANRSRIIVQCPSAGVLVMNDFFDEGWKATVDGVETPTLRVNGNQMAVPVASGSHVVEFRYRPAIFLVSLAIALGGLLVVAWLSVARNFFEPPRALPDEAGFGHTRVGWLP